MQKKTKKEDISAHDVEVMEPVDDVKQEICFSQEEFTQNMRLIEEKEQMLDELTAAHKRLQADFENFRRRTRIEKEELSQVITESVMTKLLPVIDNFDRALTSAPVQDATAIVEGVELIYRQFLTTLEKMDIRPITAVGSSFDPKLHEAVMSVPDENCPDGTVVEEFQRGYTLGAKAIRPSMVKVVTNC